MYTPFFTGKGRTNAAGRTSFAWLGLAPFVPGQVNPAYQSIVNGEISWKESSDVQTFGTTAFNGFRDATVGTASMSGSVKGYMAASDGLPAKANFVQPFTTEIFWLKMHLGTLVMESKAYISNLSTRGTPNEIVLAEFDFTLFGIPNTYQFTMISDNGQPA